MRHRCNSTLLGSGTCRRVLESSFATHESTRDLDSKREHVNETTSDKILSRLNPKEILAALNVADEVPARRRSTIMANDLFL